MESCQDRQNNEFQVLQAIFGDELKDLRKNKARRKWQPINIQIKLTPQQGMSGPPQIYAQITLHIICGEKYPEQVPIVRLQDGQGLSNQHIAILTGELEKLATSLSGEVMILELTQHVQKFLHEHNKPGFSSFYDEMMSRHQEKIQCEMQEKQLKEDKERQELQDEIQKRQEALKAESRERTYSRRRYMSASENSNSPLCEHRGTKFLHFDNNRGERQIHRGKCLGHSSKGSVVYAGVDMITGELLAITEWTLKCGSVGELENDGEPSDLQHSMKQIGSIEQELNHLHRLHHPNLVHYLNMKVLQQNQDSIIIYILQEFVVGTTCAFYLMESIPMAPDMLRYLASGVLSGLQYLHENNIVHKDLRDTSIHIDQSGAIKIADFSLNKRLSDIYHSSCLAKAEHDFPTIPGRGGKKMDIYRFGILLLSLSKGNIVTEEEIDWGNNLPFELRDFISKCLNSNERLRWTAEQLQEHCFIRTPFKRRELSSLPKIIHQQKQNNSEPEETPESDVNFYLPALGGHSRIQNEFQVLKWLGKGAFGDVLKVKNKLDGGIYALKRIALNPKSKQLNKKITREVKLLSRLNHENVVRYYNSWIESATIEPCTTTPTKLKEDDNPESDDIERLAPPIHDVEWSVSYKSRASAIIDNEEGDSESDDGDWGFSITHSRDSSDSVEFQRDDSEYQDSISDDKIDDTQDVINEIQFMYIQMEFCEKSTLRTAIDNGLYEDEERIWRLFREMVEGIAHIHQQGMIHRDLKPVNIFLDSNDHVKIGDFGLATTDIRQVVPVDKSSNFDLDELGSLTGQVGTALYVAPELMAQTTKAIYNQKVDIYSLGIILFEMCFRPLTTGMERVQVLLNLRSKDIILPSEIIEMPHVVPLLQWLLNHDPSQRPTSQELLTSEYLPPPQLEEAEHQEMVRHTLSNSQSKAYKFLIACCFAQEVTPAEDITYDMNWPTSAVNHDTLLYEYVKSKVIEVFRRHGGVNLTTPLLMPKSEQFYSHTAASVKLMTHSGSIVSIPYDLRAPFARYIAWNNVLHFRRYAIERVYREKKVHGFHPRELYECAFDIISPMTNLMAEAELITIAWEICNEIPELRQRNFTIRLNHTSLLQAVLMYCGIEPEKYHDIYSILADARDGKFSKFQVQTHFISLCLTDQAMETLFNLFDTESPVAKIASVLQTITKRKGDAAVLAKEGLRDINIVTAYALALGVKWQIMVMPLLVHNMQQHTGVIFQISTDLKRRRRGAIGNQDVIAAGGRYDKMLMSFRQRLKHTGLAIQDIKQHGVGISISLDKLVCALGELTNISKSISNCNVAVGCVDGNPKRQNEMADVLRELWSLGLRVTALDFLTTEEFLDYCREHSISHAITLKSGEKHLRLQYWERDIFQEKKISITDIAEHIQKPTENSLPTNLNRSESSKVNINSNEITSGTSHTPVNINVNFVLTERDRLSGSTRRSAKNSMLAQMSSHLQKISYKIPIEVFAVSLDTIVIKTMISVLETDAGEHDFQKSVQLVIEKHPRHKKYIEDICDEISEVRNEKHRPVLVLYSLIDSHFKILL